MRVGDIYAPFMTGSDKIHRRLHPTGSVPGSPVAVPVAVPARILFYAGLLLGEDGEHDWHNSDVNDVPRNWRWKGPGNDETER